MELKSLQKTWPGWTVVEEIGKGSFGTVYKIEREDIAGKYNAALKIISIPQDKSEIKELLSSGMDISSTTAYFESVVKEIVKEFTLMEELKGQTNIVTYEDHAVVPHDDGIGWDILIRMELLTPLSDRICFQPMSEEEVIRLGIDICTALELCEISKIIHRDIKAENIFVSKFGNYKLGDFGIARTAEKTMSAMSKKGTYTYMAPEVYRGDVYDASVDIYSLGILMYRLMNNNRAPFLPPAPEPITFESKENALQNRMSGEIIPPPANGSDTLKTIIGKACAFHPGERFASAKEMKDALEQLQKSDVSKPHHIKEVSFASVDVADADDKEEKTIGTFDAKISQIQTEENNEKESKETPDNQEKKTSRSKKPVLVISALLFLAVIVIISVWSLGNNQAKKEYKEDEVVGEIQRTTIYYNGKECEVLGILAFSPEYGYTTDLIVGEQYSLHYRIKQKINGNIYRVDETCVEWYLLTKDSGDENSISSNGTFVPKEKGKVVISGVFNNCQASTTFTIKRK